MSLRIVTVRGVAGGMSAATRTRRMNQQASIIVLEKNGFVSFASPAGKHLSTLHMLERVVTSPGMRVIAAVRSTMVLTPHLA